MITKEIKKTSTIVGLTFFHKKKIVNQLLRLTSEIYIQCIRKIPMNSTLAMFLIYFSILFRAYMWHGAHTHECGACGGVKRVLDSPELELVLQGLCHACWECTWVLCKKSIGS